MTIQPNDLFTANGWDVRVYKIHNDEVYYVKWNSENRGRVKLENAYLFRMPVKEFMTALKYDKAQLVWE